ncbi:MAG: type II secretion system F family protein [Steroidobacteraceae bacterium]
MSKRLASADLDSGLRPERWLAMRAVMGMAATGIVCIACRFAGMAAWAPAGVAGVAAVFMPEIWLGRLLAGRDRRISRELPAYLDLLTVSVEAGAALTAGVRLIVERSPRGPLRDYFERVLREIRSGRTRAEAFSAVADLYAVPALSSLATALVHGEAAGMSLGNVLRAQGAQRTAERFAAAEKLAMQAPVKLLGPLILCIFPCTFIVLAVPIIVRLREALAS